MPRPAGISTLAALGAAFLSTIWANNPPVCGANPLAAAADTIFTQQYYNNYSPLQYYVLRGCSGTRTIDSINAQVLRGNADFQADLYLTGGTPSLFDAGISYSASSHQFRYNYYPAATKLSIAANVDVVINNPGLDGCIQCPVVGQAAPSAKGDTLVVKINFLSGGLAYPVILKSVIRNTPGSAIHGSPAFRKPGGKTGLFLPEFLGRKIRTNPRSLP